jgi:hypothetical protein
MCRGVTSSKRVGSGSDEKERLFEVAGDRRPKKIFVLGRRDKEKKEYGEYDND